jgi:hypothetical protein
VVAADIGKISTKGNPMFKRLIPVAGILGLLTIALAGSAAAGGGGGYGSPGLSKFTDWSASASLTDPATGGFYGGLYVDRGMQSFKLKHTPRRPRGREAGDGPLSQRAVWVWVLDHPGLRLGGGP